MAYWNSRGLRGSTFEELINLTNERYREHGLALVQKIPTSIKAVKLDNEKRNIKEAYFEKRSTVDYIGVVQGIPICFEAKETTKDILPLQNIHEHQINYMMDFEKQDGIAFLLVSFSKYNEHYFLSFGDLMEYIHQAQKGGRKSIPYNAFLKSNLITSKSGYYLHYLEALKGYLEQK
jgi:recombination protein U